MATPSVELPARDLVVGTYNSHHLSACIGTAGILHDVLKAWFFGSGVNSLEIGLGRRLVRASILDWVRDAVTLHVCKRNHRMNLRTFLAHNVLDFNSADRQRIGNKRTVTTPCDRFRGHHR